MRENQVSKSTFKAKALELFRQVEDTRRPIIITDRGEPVLILQPYKNDDATQNESLKGTVLKFIDPLEKLA